MSLYFIYCVFELMFGPSIQSISKEDTVYPLLCCSNAGYNKKYAPVSAQSSTDVFLL